MEVAGRRAPPPEDEEPHLEPHEVNSPASGETSSAAPVGGFGLQRRHHRDDVYLEYTPADTNKGNPLEAPFPEFHGERPVRDLSWTWETQTPEKFLVGEIKEIIRKRVVEAGLNGATLFFTMRERRVMPLAERRMPMWLYFGTSDQDRAFAEELPEDDLYSWLVIVLKGADRDNFRVLAPFDCKNPPNLRRNEVVDFRQEPVVEDGLGPLGSWP
ncbi:putative gypsy-type retrotransposon [Panicum miliaceum]|uniref:Gypsy-type retrotransposon n=1 Tax=Panicum miliaceum TaxID=4540 RepID=A0A3L6Q3X0_PANMI|nr:putative gypsy-type retrotransposon [Panicum miliaceum]